ncbi:MAG: hypothetical protein ACXVQX_03320, partial [Actinomycetota bacterium]
AYAVPDEHASDRVMIAVQPSPGKALDPGDLFEFLTSQPDLSPKWLPTYVVIASELPRGVTGKVLVRELRREKFFSARGDVFWRERGDATFRPFTPDDDKRLCAAFEASGRAHARPRGEILPDEAPRRRDDPAPAGRLAVRADVDAVGRSGRAADLRGGAGVAPQGARALARAHTAVRIGPLRCVVKA